MPIAADVKVTTEILWKGALVFALIDTAFLFLLVHRVEPATFRRLKWTLVITTVIFWCLLFGTLMSWIFWAPVYHYVFPDWARWLIPPVYGVLFGAVSLLFWSLAVRVRGNPVLSFCILGGLWGAVTHIWAIQRGLLEKPPMLQGASPVAAAVMPIFEFIFYWCIILMIASLTRRVRRNVTGLR